jgi:hypothetical protein
MEDRMNEGPIVEGMNEDLEVSFPLFAASEFPKQEVQYSAHRLLQDPSEVYLQAVGVNPTSGYTTFFRIGPELIHPPIIYFINIPPSGAALQCLTPFKASIALKWTGFRSVTVKDIGGTHHIEVENF